jgi:CO/xanthine dehydrogenase FAD-binding subunit
VKPPAFGYVVPASLEQALRLAAEYGDDGKVLAGGQSLMPILNFRLASPSVLIDLNRLDGLSGIAVTPSGGLAIGALTRHRALERSADVRRHCPLISAAMPHIAHVQIRNRGTIGGSVSHADPAAELPALMLACGAEMIVRHATGARSISADAFFLGTFTTALRDDEILTEIRLPPWPTARRWGFGEVARRHGDFALAGAAVWLDCEDGSGTCTAARIVAFGVSEAPLPLTQAEQILIGAPVTRERAREAARIVAIADYQPSSDIHASAEYRREVCAVMVRRALEDALDREGPE